MSSDAKKKNYGFKKALWDVLKKEVFQQFWVNGGLVYYLDPKTILALVPGYTDPDRKENVKRTLASSWQEKNSDPEANLTVIETLSNEHRASIREVIHNPYRGHDLFTLLFFITALVVGAYFLIHIFR